MEHEPQKKSEVSYEAKISLVERRRQEAFTAVLQEVEKRLLKDIGSHFESHGREYELTSPEDCMVAYAQMMLTEIKKLHEEIVAKNDYREEQAIAKILELFQTYERMIALYTELRSYYPNAATCIEAHIPSLTETAKHGEMLWHKIQNQK